MQGTRAVIYTRVSSQQQEDEGSSLATQLASCRAYAADHGYLIVGEYTDTWSGAQYRERAGLSHVRAAVRNHEADIVLCHALDRLSRNQTHTAVLVDEIEHHGARIELVTESFDDTSAGRLIRSVQSFAAEVEREKIIERSGRGRHARVVSGKPLPGPRPMYGYRWQDPDPKQKTRLVPDPDTSLVIQRIFHEAASGITRYAIATRLTEDNVPTPTGRNRSWRAETIADILKRPHYAGRPLGWVDRSHYRARRYAEAPNAVALPADTYPALVSVEEWELANEWTTVRHISRRRKNAREQTALLVGGFIRCGYCGRPMHTKWWCGKIQNYTCNGDRGAKGSCEMPTISVKKMDDAVWSRIEAFMSRPELILEELERHRDSDPTASDMAPVERQLRDVERQQGNLTRRLATIDDDGIATLVMNELRTRREQQARLESERERLDTRRRQWETAQQHIDGVSEWCRTVSRNLDTLSYDERRTLLTALDTRVMVYKSDHDPRYTVDAAVSLGDNSTIPDTSRRGYRC